MPDRAVSTVVDDVAGLEGRRRAILHAAAGVIARDGVDGLRMATVARAAGVSSALLHYYFATREELIRLSFDLHDREAAVATAERLAAIGDPLERVRDQLAHQLQDDPAVRDGWVIWTEMQRLAVFDEDVRASVVERSLRWVGAIAELIGDAQAAGQVADGIDAVDAALCLTAVVDGLGAHVLIGSLPRATALRLMDAQIATVLGT